MVCKVCEKWNEEFQAKCDCVEDSVTLAEQEAKVYGLDMCISKPSRTAVVPPYSSGDMVQLSDGYYTPDQRGEGCTGCSSCNDCTSDKGTYMIKDDYMEEMLDGIAEVRRIHRSDKEGEEGIDTALIKIILNATGMLNALLEEDKLLESLGE